MTETIAVSFRERRLTAALWTSRNPTLNEAEIGFEKDTGKFKIGPVGGAPWNSLPYAAIQPSAIGANNGVAGLDSTGKLPLNQHAVPVQLAAQLAYGSLVGQAVTTGTPALINGLLYTYTGTSPSAALPSSPNMSNWTQFGDGGSL